MTRMCFSVLALPIYRGREQHGKGREAGDKGTGNGRAGYGRREILTPLSPPPPPPRTADAKVNIFMLRGYQAIVLHCSPALYFRSNFIVFISTAHVGFSNEDNCCQTEGIGKSIKKTLSKLKVHVF